MTLITCALKFEAKPLIQGFKLTHLAEITEYKVYGNEHISLIITGVGKLKCSVATGFFIGKFGVPDLALNVGVCGSAILELPVGTAILAHKIYDVSSDRSFFSTISFSHQFKEATLYTYDKPVHFEHLDFVAVDMEASGFFVGASKFLPQEKIFAIKVVSDHLENKKLEPSFIEEIVFQKIGYIQDLINTLATKKRSPTLSTLDRLSLKGERN